MWILNGDLTLCYKELLYHHRLTVAKQNGHLCCVCQLVLMRTDTMSYHKVLKLIKLPFLSNQIGLRPNSSVTGCITQLENINL